MTWLAVGCFRVDLDALDFCVETLTRTQAELEALSHDLEAQLLRLHEEWRGEAALAHAQAQHRWESSFHRLRESLAALSVAARHAHGSYAAATDANQAMWSQLR